MIRFMAIVLFIVGGFCFLFTSMLVGAVFLGTGAIFGIWGTVIEANQPQRHTSYRRTPGTLDDPRPLLPDSQREAADKAGADPLGWLNEMPPQRHR